MSKPLYARLERFKTNIARVMNIKEKDANGTILMKWDEFTRCFNNAHLTETNEDIHKTPVCFKLHFKTYLDHIVTEMDQAVPLEVVFVTGDMGTQLMQAINAMEDKLSANFDYVLPKIGEKGVRFILLYNPIITAQDFVSVDVTDEAIVLNFMYHLRNEMFAFKHNLATVKSVPLRLSTKPVVPSTGQSGYRSYIKKVTGDVMISVDMRISLYRELMAGADASGMTLQEYLRVYFTQLKKLK